MTPDEIRSEIRLRWKLVMAYVLALFIAVAVVKELIPYFVGAL